MHCVFQCSTENNYSYLKKGIIISITTNIFSDNYELFLYIYNELNVVIYYEFTHNTRIHFYL